MQYLSNQVVQGTIFQSASQTNFRGPEENHVHVVPASGSHVLRSLQVRGGLHRSDDATRATGQLYLQVHR